MWQAFHDRGDKSSSLCPDRRQWLKAMGAAALMGSVPGLRGLLAQEAEALQSRGKSCILLWMQGGPSQFETFDPKPGHDNGGETRAISTSIPGIELAENLPELAKVMEKFAVIRSLTAREGSHPRASYLWHTGYLPTASIQHPTLGSIVAHQVGSADSDLPAFVRIGRPAGGGAAGAGFLGVRYDPLVVADASRPPENTAPRTDERRFRRRLRLVQELEGIDSQFALGMGEHRDLLERSSRMMLSPKMEVFDIDRESAGTRDRYGDSPFGRGCLLARRLVDQGLPFIEVSLGNWDSHLDNFQRCRTLCGSLDRPFAALLEDLERRGKLESTLVVCVGEFGRTPRINPRGGRDHYPRAFSAAVAGCGISGGQVIGQTDSGGTEVTQRPIEVADFFRTVLRALDIDPDHENMSGAGRPIPLVTGGSVISELFG